MAPDAVRMSQCMILQPQEIREPMNWRYIRVATAAGFVLVVLIAVLVGKSPFRQRTVVRAYFADAMGLSDGATVRLAGVDIGYVKSVRARSEMKDTPAELVMVITTPYELRIPSDAIASLKTEGVLGQTYVDIDVRNASAAPIALDAVLKTVVTPQVSTQEVIDKFSEVLSRKCDCSKTTNSSDESARTPSGKPQKH